VKAKFADKSCVYLQLQQESVALTSCADASRVVHTGRFGRGELFIQENAAELTVQTHNTELKIDYFRLPPRPHVQIVTLVTLLTFSTKYWLARLAENDTIKFLTRIECSDKEAGLDAHKVSERREV